MAKDSIKFTAFIGLVSYFRKFIKSFSHFAKPLFNLLKMKSEFKFGEVELNTFLAIYDPHAKTELHCDASFRGFGAILFQGSSDRKLDPVFYFSQRESNTEVKYHSFELGKLAIIYALK